MGRWHHLIIITYPWIKTNNLNLNLKKDTIIINLTYITDLAWL